MTDQEYARHLMARQDLARRFIAEPHLYKICDQCRSVSKISVGICPLCHTYRFNQDPEYVRETAKIIGKSAFPRTAGTVPRFR